FNRAVLDGAVHLFAFTARGLGAVVNLFDRTVIDGAVNGAGEGADLAGRELRYGQNGNVQRYAAFLLGFAIIGVVLVAYFMST
ncbi:MAG: hypothetical protein HY240_08650, partial [Actinobacteria bacterium]|nr:hypothetical protein [Actinomycetota bacterium]